VIKTRSGHTVESSVLQGKFYSNALDKCIAVRLLKQSAGMLYYIITPESAENTEGQVPIIAEACIRSTRKSISVGSYFYVNRREITDELLYFFDLMEKSTEQIKNPD